MTKPLWVLWGLFAAVLLGLWITAIVLGLTLG